MAKVAVVEPAAPTPLATLAHDYLASCRARGLAPTTLRAAYGYTLDDVLLPWCSRNSIATVDQLNQRVLDRFTADLLTIPSRRGKPLSRYTAHHYVRVVRQFLTWCQKEGEGAAPGRPQLPRLPQRVVEVLSREEIERLETFALTERDKLIIRLLADTGIRVGELCSLRRLTSSSPRTGGPF
jgi:integrase